MIEIPLKIVKSKDNKDFVIQDIDSLFFMGVTGCFLLATSTGTSLELKEGKENKITIEN